MVKEKIELLFRIIDSLGKIPKLVLRFFSYMSIPIIYQIWEKLYEVRTEDSIVGIIAIISLLAFAVTIWDDLRFKALYK